MKLYYFTESDTKDIDALKSKYKLLSKRNHPDLGGCVEAMKAMKAINCEYEVIFESLMRGKNLFGSMLEDALKQDKELREKVDAIISLENIIIEICGTWVWVTGDTRTVKDKLKELSFKWARKKCAWYFHTGTFTKRSKKSYSLDDIHSRHGSKSIGKIRRKQIA